MLDAERRSVVRKSLRVPLRFRILGANVTQIYAGESHNVCPRGVFFTTNQAPGVGASLEVFLKAPDEAAGTLTPEVRCTGRVVHVQAKAGPNGQSGVGVRIDRFEPASATVDWLG